LTPSAAVARPTQTQKIHPGPDNTARTTNPSFPTAGRRKRPPWTLTTPIDKPRPAIPRHQPHQTSPPPQETPGTCAPRTPRPGNWPARSSPPQESSLRSPACVGATAAKTPRSVPPGLPGESNKKSLGNFLRHITALSVIFDAIKLLSIQLFRALFTFPCFSPSHLWPSP